MKKYTMATKIENFIHIVTPAGNRATLNAEEGLEFSVQKIENDKCFLESFANDIVWIDENILEFGVKTGMIVQREEKMPSLLAIISRLETIE